MEGQFDSVFAPPAGLEPATGTLTLPVISMIEDTIYFLRVKGWIHQTERLLKIFRLQPCACRLRFLNTADRTTHSEAR